MVVVLVDEVVPDAHDREEEVNAAQPAVEDEEQEESLVLEADAVVGEDAVVAHMEHTSLTH